MAMNTKLSCGCIPGFFLCPEAVRLWAEVRNLAPQYERDNKYRAAYQRYDAHVSDCDEHEKGGSHAPSSS